MKTDGLSRHLISVITPAYNASKYISETIESVQKQTYTDWELIIVDDGSSDATYIIACKYAIDDKRIRVLKHDVNYGVAAARNTALDVATGEYIAFLDSDDLWAPQKLEKQLAFMEANHYVLTYTMYQILLCDENKLGKIISVPNRMTYEEVFKNTCIACLTVMVNRKVVGDFHMPLLDHSEDQCTWQEIMKRGYIAYSLKENLSLYRVRGNSLTVDKKKVIKRQWYSYRVYYRFSIIKSGIYFIQYAFNALKKHI